MPRTLITPGHGEIEWRRPGTARSAAQRRWLGREERPSFLQLLVPLVALAVGSILVAGALLAVFVLVLTALF
jgi:hypothetical protein